LQVRGVERFKPLDRLGDFSVSVRLDNQPWGEFEPLSRGTVTVSNLTTGDHVVRVRVQDQGLDVDETPAVWQFRLHPVPLQDRSWFQPLVVAILLTVLTLAGLSVAAYRRELGQRRRKQELEHEILEISEREQRRIGQDLHDGLGQRLTSISFQCEAARGMLKTSDAHSSQRLREIGAAVRAAIAETRTLAHALYPAEVDSGDLKLALGYLVGSIDRGFDGECTYHHHWSPVVLSREDALNVYRLVQEALGNAIRHSGAATLHVESRRDDGQWIIEVRDDGCGFDTENPAGRGLGLQIMRYRADLIGGSLIVVSRPDGGTTIRCVLRIEGEES
jgi:signal transduction histidine kinase